MRTKGSKNKPFVLDLSGFKLLKEAAAKAPPLVGTKEDVVNQRLDNLEDFMKKQDKFNKSILKALDLLARSNIIWEK